MNVGLKRIIHTMSADGMEESKARGSFSLISSWEEIVTDLHSASKSVETSVRGPSTKRKD